MFHIAGASSFVWGAKTRGIKTGYQHTSVSQAGGTLAFWLLSTDYNVFGSTEIVLNNFIQYSRCRIVQLFQLTPFSKPYRTQAYFLPLR